MKQIRIYEYGEPSVMRLETVPDPAPGPGEVLVEVKAAGVNFVDIYERLGLYKTGLPLALGREGSGVVRRVGEEVSGVNPGDRVAWAGIGASYATHVTIPWERLAPIPDGLDFQQGGASMLQGMTAHYLSRSAYLLKEGDICLVHAAAGGVGLLLCQMARMSGARVIGTVSTEAKAVLAAGAGAGEVILYAKQDFESEVKRLTEGRGVDVVYDSVGKATFEKSLNCLKHRGTLVLFGQSSGPVPPFDPQVLNAKGSLFLTRPTLVHYVETREELIQRASEVHGWILSGKLRLRIDRTYPLEQAPRAHEALASRAVMGKILLLP